MHNDVDVLKATKLYTLKWEVLCYIYFTIFLKEIKNGNCIRDFLSSLKLSDLANSASPPAPPPPKKKNLAKTGYLLPPPHEVTDRARQADGSAPS